ncbi:TetR family transcriptional regulator BioQ [Arthrobacter tecti]
MALSREQIIDAALRILNSYGFADLSMRRLARELDVQPGALYWHVKNKQDLLTVVAERILEPVAFRSGGAEKDAIRQTAEEIRGALLAVRGAADVVSLAQTLSPNLLLPGLESLFGSLDGRQARWAARALVHYILGAVAEEQTHAELAQAGLLPENTPDDDGAAFRFGVDRLVAGLLSG